MIVRARPDPTLAGRGGGCDRTRSITAPWSRTVPDQRRARGGALGEWLFVDPPGHVRAAALAEIGETVKDLAHQTGRSSSVQSHDIGQSIVELPAGPMHRCRTAATATARLLVAEPRDYKTSLCAV